MNDDKNPQDPHEVADQEPSEPTEDEDIEYLKANVRQLIILDYLSAYIVPRIELEREVNG
jgi:hypothetical protein